MMEMVCVVQLVLPVCGLGKILRFFFVSFSQYILCLDFHALKISPCSSMDHFLFCIVSVFYAVCFASCVFLLLKRYDQLLAVTSWLLYQNV